MTPLYINNIAGFYRMPVNTLLGVFLGPGLPTSNPAPGEVLNFRDIGVARFGTQVGTHFATLSPELEQIFFIGDGLTGTGSGSVQTFIAPAGATRLYLGVADGYGWANNSGAFDVCVNCGSVPEFSAGSAVPEPSTWAMLLLGFGGLGFGGYLRSKKIGSPSWPHKSATSRRAERLSCPKSGHGNQGKGDAP